MNIWVGKNSRGNLISMLESYLRSFEFFADKSEHLSFVNLVIPNIYPKTYLLTYLLLFPNHSH